MGVELYSVTASAAGAALTMVDVFLERRFGNPMTAEEFLSDARHAAGCFDLYRVDWQLSMLGADGQNCVCWFSGTDAESVREAQREAGMPVDAVWTFQRLDQTSASSTG